MRGLYLKAIEKNNSDAMCKLGEYYHYIEKNYAETKRYYEMAIETDNNTSAMCHLGVTISNARKTMI